MKPANAYLRQEMRSYLATVPDATEQELAALNMWVRQGNSPYCNPSHIADEQGREMPFVLAMRVENELAESTASEITKPYDYSVLGGGRLCRPLLYKIHWRSTA